MPEEQVREHTEGTGQVNQSQDWSASATTRAAELAAIYDTTLRDVAESFAVNQRAEVVLTAHVEEAHTALARVGLGRFNWLGRPESETALGGIFIGLAAGGNDILAPVLGNGQFHDGATIIWVVLFFVAGFALCIHGWYRGKLPSPIGHRTIAEKVILDFPRSAWFYFFPPKPPAH